MPLYVDDFPPLSLPHAYMRALVNIAEAAGAEPVNPAKAIKLLRDHLGALVPLEVRHVFSFPGQPTWERIHTIYPQLAFASEGVHKELIAAAKVVDLVVRHTTSPPREFAQSRSLEVSSFARISSLLGIPVTSPVVQLGGRMMRLYDFCKYCWLPAVSHGVCLYHSTQHSYVQIRLPPCATTFKQAQRLRESFEDHLARLVTTEELEFHDTEFSAPVLLPPSGMMEWLRRRRPHLAAAIERANESSEERPLTHLLGVLYGDFADAVGDAVGGAVQLVTPITTRAEAWLKANESRPRRGGSRRRGGPADGQSAQAPATKIELVILDWDTLSTATSASAYVEDCQQELLAATATDVLALPPDLTIAERLTLLESYVANLEEKPAGSTWCCIVFAGRDAAIEVELAPLGNLDALGIKLFCANEVTQHVNKATLLTRAAHGLGVKPSCCLVVGGSSSEDGAKIAGMHFALIGPSNSRPGGA